MADSLKTLESFCAGPVIAGGDLNCLMDCKMDYSGDRGQENTTTGEEKRLTPLTSFSRYTIYKTSGDCTTPLNMITLCFLQGINHNHA